jgi:hypothetical protein
MSKVIGAVVPHLSKLQDQDQLFIKTLLQKIHAEQITMLNNIQLEKIQKIYQTVCRPQ